MTKEKKYDLPLTFQWVYFATNSSKTKFDFRTCETFSLIDTNSTSIPYPLMDCTAHVYLNQPVPVIYGSSSICCTGARSKGGGKLLARHLVIGGRRSIYSRRLYQFIVLLASPILCLTAILLRLIIVVFTWNWSRIARHACWYTEARTNVSCIDNLHISFL